MKLGRIEVSGIKRVVENQKVVWERYPNRWVKYVNNIARDGKSTEQMHHFLNMRVWDNRYRVWTHNETINITKVK